MKQLIDEILKESRFAENPYFTSLRSRTFDKSDFIETQIQFYTAVAFFSRPMATLAARIPTDALRQEIVRNVWEEHGEGNPEQSHSATFQEFLSRLGGITRQDIDQRALWPEMRIFNTTLAGAATLDEYIVSAAMFGMIERMFCEISSWIGNSLVEQGWVTRDQMIHYNLHEKLDIRHADDFFNVVRPAWDASSDNRYSIEQGLRMGATLFNGLYESLYQNRKRRLARR